MKRVLLKIQMAVWMTAVLLVMMWRPLAAQEKPAGSTTSGWERDDNTVQKTDKASTNQDDTEFLKQAYEAGMAEIDLGNVALQNASSESVRQYAQRLVDDFTKANQELQSIADVIASPVAPTIQPSAITNNNVQPAEPGEKEKYPYLHNPALRKNLDDFNVSGSGLGTGGGSTGTAISRPDRPRKSAPSQAYAGTGTGSGTETGTGGGFGGTVKDSAGTSTLTNLSQPITNNMADSRGGSTRPNPKAGSILSAELSSEHQALKDKLLFLSGAEFDREYIKAAKANHADLTKLLESEISGGSNEQVKQWAMKQLTMVREYQSPVLKTSKTKASSSGW